MAESKTEYSRWFILYTLVFSLAVSIISGMASGWYFSRSDNKEIVVLDVVKIIEAKKKEFVEKYRDREANPRMKEDMEREISFFTDRLNRIVEEESRGRIVLVRDSVISEAKDITNDVEAKIKSTH
ncbi:MAG: TrbI F-type domain-containing protein [Thermodesulfobacteriota bacterium]